MMPRGFSLYLDVVRFAAAGVVLITHLAYRELSGGQLAAWRAVGNDAVMVFFVLSGLVIANAVAGRETTFRDYALSRLARLWSVVLPALAITLVLDRTGAMLNPAAYNAWWNASDGALWRMLSAATFTNELWFSHVRVLSNGPFWSLGYEFWFYVLFAAWTFLHGRRRVVVLAALCLLIGPKILLLSPAWVLGVVVQRHRGALPPKAAILLFALPIALYALFRASGTPALLYALTVEGLGQEAVLQRLHFSDEFLSSLILGPLVAAHFLGARALTGVLERGLGAAERLIRPLAAATFAIYLVHYPLLRFVRAVWTYDETSPVAVAVVFAMTLALCVLAGLACEPLKPRLKAALAGLWPDRHAGADSCLPDKAAASLGHGPAGPLRPFS